MLPVVQGERRDGALRSSATRSSCRDLAAARCSGETVGAALPRVRARARAPPSSAFALALQRQTTPARARRLFSYSLAYLALLFVAMAVDPVVIG